MASAALPLLAGGATSIGFRRSSTLSCLNSTFRGLALNTAPSRQQCRAHSVSLAVTVCKLKTHKASAKRFKVTGGGILMRRRAGKQHLLVKKNAKRKRRLSKMVPVSRRDYTGICRACPYMKVKRRHLLRSARRALGLPLLPGQTQPEPPSTEPAAAEE